MASHAHHRDSEPDEGFGSLRAGADLSCDIDELLPHRSLSPSAYAPDDALGEEISELTATRDLKAMVDAGLLEPVGERRARFYVASATWSRLVRRFVTPVRHRDSEDPFERAATQLALPI